MMDDKRLMEEDEVEIITLEKATEIANKYAKEKDFTNVKYFAEAHKVYFAFSFQNIKEDNNICMDNNEFPEMIMVEGIWGKVRVERESKEKIMFDKKLVTEKEFETMTLEEATEIANEYAKERDYTNVKYFRKAHNVYYAFTFQDIKDNNNIYRFSKNGFPEMILVDRIFGQVRVNRYKNEKMTDEKKIERESKEKTMFDKRLSEEGKIEIITLEKATEIAKAYAKEKGYTNVKHFDREHSICFAFFFQDSEDDNNIYIDNNGRPIRNYIGFPEIILVDRIYGRVRVINAMIIS